MSHLAPITLPTSQPRNNIATVEVAEEISPAVVVASKLTKRRRTRSSSSSSSTCSRKKITDPPKSRDMPKITTTSVLRHSRRKDFILRSAPKHFNYWTSDHLKDILRTKIEGRSKRRCNRNRNALKFLGGSAKNGINAQQLRRRCLRMALPLTRPQSNQLFREISDGSDASISVHQFLLGLFPNDYEASLTNNLNKQQTLMGLSEIDRAGKLGVDWNKKKAIHVSTMRWSPQGILQKLQQAFVKRGGGVATALKRYQTMRRDDPAKNSSTHLGKLEMRMVINTIFRIPASCVECDRFFEVMSNGKPTIQFAKMFRSLEGGVITRENRFAQANRGPTVSDIIGNYGSNKGNDTFDDTASWVSLASTRAPSLVNIVERQPPRPSTAGSARSSGRRSSSSRQSRYSRRPSTAGSQRSSLNSSTVESYIARSLSSVLSEPRSSALPSARARSIRSQSGSSSSVGVPRPQSATNSRGVMSIAINTASHYRRLRQLAKGTLQKKKTSLLYQKARATSARQLY